MTPAAFSARTLLLVVTCAAASALAVLATPQLKEDVNRVDLEARVPRTIGEWQELPTPFVLVPLEVNSETSINQPYDQTVMRTYKDAQGHQVSLALAWGKHQRQEVKIHRPELCYPAQGYSVEKLTSIQFPLNAGNGEAITGKRMVTRDRAGRIEAVSYWIRLGASYSDSAWETRLHILREGLAGRVTDGMLVRVSTRTSPDANLDEVFARQERFASQLVAASPADVRHMLVR